MSFRYASLTLLRYIVPTTIYDAYCVFHAGKYAGLEKNIKIKYGWATRAGDDNSHSILREPGCTNDKMLVGLIRYNNVSCYYYHILPAKKRQIMSFSQTYEYAIYRLTLCVFMRKPIYDPFIYGSLIYYTSILDRAVLRSNHEFEKIIYANRLSIKPLK